MDYLSTATQNITKSAAEAMPQTGKKRKNSGPGASIPKHLKSTKQRVHPGFNLAGRRPSKYLNSIKSVLKKTTGVFQPGNLGTDTYWKFVIRSSKYEWIRFFPHSISAVIFGVYDNPNREVGHANPERAAARHSLRALSGLPYMFLDPTALGTSFVKGVEVTINNVPVKTNEFNTHLLQYTRVNRIFNSNPDPHFDYNTDMNRVADRQRNQSKIIQRACMAFDYETFNNPNGTRIPVFMDGIFPFDVRNRTIESVEKSKETTLYFPPDTTIEIKVLLWPSNMAGIFHPNCNNYTVYTDNTDVAEVANLLLTFQDVTLEYETAELKEHAFVQAMQDYSRGNPALYDYDVVRSQHQALANGQSFTENIFQIPPRCRLVYILFMPSHSVMLMDRLRRPLSGYSQFPNHNTRMSVGFAGDPHLITPYFERFGDRDESHQISKMIYYAYLTQNGMFKGRFEELFNRTHDIDSLNQVLVLDLQPYESVKSEYLTLRCEFTGNTSPDNIQILLFSVHQTGRGICRQSPTKNFWDWSFELQE